MRLHPRIVHQPQAGDAKSPAAMEKRGGRDRDHDWELISQPGPDGSILWSEDCYSEKDRDHQSFQSSILLKSEMQERIKDAQE